MGKKDYIWTFRSSTLVSGQDAPFSLEYHIPSPQLKIVPEDLIGSRLWLVMKDNGDSLLYAVLAPSSIEQYQEGRYKDDYLMSSKPFCSIRLLPRRESKSAWVLSDRFSEQEGIRECNEEDTKVLENLISQNTRTGFTAPSRSVLQSVPHTKFVEPELAAPDQLASTLRTTAFGDISRSRDFPSSVSAFGGVALTALKQAQPHIDFGIATEMIASLDPLSPTQEAKIKNFLDIQHATGEVPPLIDTFLEPIDPEKISPRKFVARSTDANTDWLDKTNRAEENHESILKDVVLKLKENGYETLKSRSFDLVAKKRDIHMLFEIKSADKRNVGAQAEKGIIQLLRYATAIPNERLDTMRMCVLLQDPGTPAVLPHLAKMANRAGSELWLYDNVREWPQRVLNLHKETLPGV